MDSSVRSDMALTLNDVIAAQEVSNLKARYFRFMDTKQWDAWLETFALDATMDMSGEPGAFEAAGYPPTSEAPAPSLVFRGREEIRAAVSGALDGVSSCHHGHVCEFELTSPTTARALWSMEDVISHGGTDGFRGYGHYHDTYAKINGSWRIKSTRLSRLMIVPFTPLDSSASLDLS